MSSSSDGGMLKKLSIGRSEGGVIAKQFTLMSEWHMQHELLLTVLLILWTFWVGWAVWPDDDHHFLPPL